LIFIKKFSARATLPPIATDKHIAPIFYRYFATTVFITDITDWFAGQCTWLYR